MSEPIQDPTNPDSWETDFHRWGKRPLPEPSPFFYTRLQARLAPSSARTDELPWWLRQPAYAYAALLLLLLLNIGVVAGASWWSGRDQAASAATAATPLYDYAVDPIIMAYE